MLTFTASEDKQNTCFMFIGSNNTATTTHLLTDNISLLTPISNSEDCLDSCSFYNGPSDATILSFGESAESCGSISYTGAAESCGSIAYSGSAESCGSIASSSCSSSSFSGYCC